MALDRAKMVESCIEGFFLALNAKDLDRVRAGFTEDCRMLIPSSGLVYKDRHDLMVHLEDFVQAFETIHFHDFTVVPDPAEARLAATFTVRLVEPDGSVLEMRNANFFKLTADHRISQVLIIATQPLDKGFQAGRS